GTATEAGDAREAQKRRGAGGRNDRAVRADDAVRGEVVGGVRVGEDVAGAAAVGDERGVLGGGNGPGGAAREGLLAGGEVHRRGAEAPDVQAGVVGAAEEARGAVGGGADGGEVANAVAVDEAGAGDAVEVLHVHAVDSGRGRVDGGGAGRRGD